MFHRECKRFDQKKFETEPKLMLNSQTNLSYSTFQAVFRKAIMLRSRLRNNYNKKSFMKTGTIITSKGIFVWNFFAWPKKILMLKSISDNKNSGKP